MTITAATITLQAHKEGTTMNLIQVNIGCPACGKPLEDCAGHSPVRDRKGSTILKNHDRGMHDECSPSGCRVAAGIEPQATPVATVAEAMAAPAAVPVVEAPVAVPVVEAPVAVPVVEAPVAVPAVEAPVTPAPVEEPAEVVSEAAPAVELDWQDGEEPPVKERESWVEVAKALKAQPARWAIVLTSTRRPAVNRCRNALAYHKVTTRQRTKDGVISVWASFNPVLSTQTSSTSSKAPAIEWQGQGEQGGAAR